MAKFGYFLYINLIECQSILIFRFRYFSKRKLLIRWLNSYNSFLLSEAHPRHVLIKKYMPYKKPHMEPIHLVFILYQCLHLLDI